MAQKNGTKTSISLEQDKIVVETSDLKLLNHIYNLIIREIRPPAAKRTQEEIVKEFVGYCWQRSRMRTAIKLLAHNRKVAFDDIAAEYKRKYPERKTLGRSGLISGLSKSAARAGLKHWLKAEGSSRHRIYAITSPLFTLISEEVSNREEAE